MRSQQIHAIQTTWSLGGTWEIHAGKDKKGSKVLGMKAEFMSKGWKSEARLRGTLGGGWEGRCSRVRVQIRRPPRAGDIWMTSACSVQIGTRYRIHLFANPTCLVAVFLEWEVPSGTVTAPWVMSRRYCIKTIKGKEIMPIRPFLDKIQSFFLGNNFIFRWYYKPIQSLNYFPLNPKL